MHGDVAGLVHRRSRPCQYRNSGLDCGHAETQAEMHRLGRPCPNRSLPELEHALSGRRAGRD